MAGGTHVLYNLVQEEGPVKLNSKMVTFANGGLEHQTFAQGYYFPLPRTYAVKLSLVSSSSRARKLLLPGKVDCSSAKQPKASHHQHCPSGPNTALGCLGGCITPEAAAGNSLELAPGWLNP